jgi:hypothetical protein
MIGAIIYLRSELYHFRLRSYMMLTVDAVNSQQSTVNSELEFTIEMLTDLIL